jgi:endonuclease YncB( thermonuclease family)
MRGIGWVLGLLLAAAAPAVAEVGISGPATVVDGDTLDIGAVRIRLHGIDAPEADQRCAAARGGDWACGAAATARLVELVGGRPVTCAPRDRDAYGRVIAVCLAGGHDLGATLVAEGLAWAFVRYSAEYGGLEDGPRKIGAGVWQADTATAWDWRASTWERAVAEAPGGCPIKGNINRDGERIYHTPWSPWYARTRIDESLGQRWFCDEAEAIAAGWRAPRR